MKLLSSFVDGPVLIERDVYSDSRGLFIEAWRDDWLEFSGQPIVWRQDNLSVSKRKGTVRGLHWQVPPAAQAKLVRVIKGRILDVVVDIRRASSTFGTAVGVELCDGLNRSLLVPIGFAHGFCTLEQETIVTYKTSAHYDPSSERAMNWASPNLDLQWPVKPTDAILSEKDAMAPYFSDLKGEALF